ncbi:hypothetical protein DKK71_03490 [Snodgrassella alvi]|nr:hypothetical protein DKK71_03490 [Snodgrassella alvi]
MIKLFTQYYSQKLCLAYYFQIKDADESTGTFIKTLLIISVKLLLIADVHRLCLAFYHVH